MKNMKRTVGFTMLEHRINENILVSHFQPLEKTHTYVCMCIYVCVCVCPTEADDFNMYPECH